MEIYTIGFTRKTAAEFFDILRRAGIKRLVDVRLNNTSQLAGFAKRDDLEYFLKELCGAEYVHEPMLSPTQELMDAYKNKDISWDEYAERFVQLLKNRNVEDILDKRLFDVPTVLLCSEPDAEQCHRRLVVEHLDREWRGVTVRHL